MFVAIGVQPIRSGEVSITSLSPGCPSTASWDVSLSTEMDRIRGRFGYPTVVKARLHPPIWPASLRKSSTTKRDQVPFGSCPLNTESLAGNGPEGAGERKSSEVSTVGDGKTSPD